MMADDNKERLRQKILSYFYGVYRGTEASSDAGRVACGIAANEISRRTGAAREAVAALLEEMNRSGHVDQVDVQTPHGPYATYRIGSRGIEMIEGDLSLTMDSPAALGLSPRPVIVDADLTAGLQELRRLIEAEAKLNPQLRSDALRDLDTIGSQLREFKPDPGIVKAAWESIKVAAVVTGDTTLLAKCAVLLSKEVRGRYAPAAKA
jgi:hypothetical protein